MPLRVNLLAENLAAEEMRRRDPVKRVLVMGFLLILIMLVWSGYLMLKQTMERRDLAQVTMAINTHTNEYLAVLAAQKKSEDVRHRLDELEVLSTNRFFQANLMNALQHVSVPGVQLTRLRLAQTYVQVEASKPEKGKLPTPAKATEKIVLTLDLKDTSPNPGDGVNKYKDALTAQPYFQNSLDATNSVRLSGLYGLQAGTDGKQYEIFTLECHFPDNTR